MLRSKDLQVRKEAVICISNMLCTLDSTKVYSLIRDSFTTLLEDFVSNLKMVNDKTIVMTILDSVEYLLTCDRENEWMAPVNFQFLLGQSKCFDLLEDLQRNGH